MVTKDATAKEMFITVGLGGLTLKIINVGDGVA
jgi:hypothetical protein